MTLIKGKTNGKTLLSDIIKNYNVKHEKPCGGNGICGKCKIKAKGNLSPVCDEEKKHLSESEISSGFRLSCRTYVFGEFEAEINEETYNEETVYNNFNEKKCCMIVDIGTTVIEACFYSLQDFKEVKRVKVKNPQSKYGADVISRINHAKDEEIRNDLKVLLLETIEKICDNISVEYAIITGNTVMLHLYNGIDPTPIATYPYKAPCLFGYWQNNVFFPPCISSYIGADSVMAVLASDMKKEDTPSLIIDIGTNTEIILYSGEKFYCASTAAGPALEGASIKMGMFAQKGAIKSIDIDGNYQTVYNSEPKGICASGIIDAVSFMLKKDILKNDGYLEKDFEIGDSGVFITPKDIREIQLAKSAIKSGIETLLSECNIKLEEIKTVYIAGALGNSVNIDNCIKIGLFPRISKSKFRLIGNASLEGAYKIARDFSLIENATEIAKRAEHIELALLDEFTKKYIENISF